LTEDVKVIERLVAFALVVCLQMIPACGARPAVVVPSPTHRPPELPATVLAPSALPQSATMVPATIDRDDCALIPEAGEPIATVGLSDRIDPAHAPRPTNDSERLLFRQLYETLVTVDCLGRLRPALAASWRLDGGGRTWILTLREDARFADGTHVRADDVLASWSGDGVGDQRHPVESIVAIDDHAVAITLRRGSAGVDGLQVLAHSDLAIARPAAGSAWPLGTRSARVAPGGDLPRQQRLPVITVTRDAQPPLRFLVAAGDARDLLDAGADLLVTRDAATLDYARTLQLQTKPLAWQRTHVLLTPGRPRSSPALSAQARQVLADDAVRGEARGTMEPSWWQTAPGCDVLPSPLSSRSSPAPRVVYNANDAVARDLAERFVGLVRASGPAATMFLDVLLPDRPRRTYERTLGLTGAALAQALRRGADAAYVVAIDSRPVDPCRELHSLIGTAPWLDPETIVPLVETRLQAVVRHGRSGVSAEWDGGLVLVGVGDASAR
jgi:hypothetical protein